VERFKLRGYLPDVQGVFDCPAGADHHRDHHEIDVRRFRLMGSPSFPMRGGTMSATSTRMWVWESDLANIGSLEGYSVEATDGSIGSVDEATYDVGSSYIVVDTGTRIFGKKVMLPAGVVGRIDHDAERIFVHLTKEQIKDSPEFDELTYRDDEYRSSLGEYYTPFLRR
jgi:hypothetical protein